MAEPQFKEDVRRHLAVLHKRRALVITSLGVSLLVAVLYNYSTRPLYQASAQILIDRASPKVLPTSNNVDAGVQDFQTEYELIRGRSVTEKVVARLELQKNPEMMKGPMLSPWARFQRRFLGKADEPEIAGDGLPLTPAAAAIRSRLRIDPLPGGRLVNVRFTAYDPTLAAAVPNAVAEEYIQQTLNYRFTRSSEATGWLGERLEEQKRKVEQAEKALLDYQAQNGLVSSHGESTPDDATSSLSAAMLTARMDRMSRENVLGQIKGMPPAQVATLPVIAGHPLVQDARTKLAVVQAEQVRLGETVGDKHPDMLRVKAEILAAQDKLQTEVRNAIRGLESEYQTARAHEESLERNLEQARRQGLEVGRKSIEYDALRREVETNKQVFQALMSRSKETGLESELRTTNVRVVERAEPPGRPTSPNRPENYRIALLVGISLGIFLAFLFEHADSSLKTPEDVKEMGLPFLGMVPAVAPTAGATASNSLKPASLRNPEGAVAEAYRILRTNLLFTCPGDSGRVLVFTSANPGEGKTTTSANVAGALALNGAKVLVIDADLRRPTMHQHFGASKTPGLSDLIVGKAQPSEVIQNTRFKGVFLLPCGYIAPNPTELLGSPAMRELLKVLKTRFDWVIVDTPPVLAMADTPVLAQFVDGVVLVLAAEATTRPSIQRSMDQLTSVGGHILGAVLNKVDLRRNSYYYSHYYGEYYRSYYAEATTPARVASGPRPVRR
jgi:polysaccharide biosynthesis transport protein